MKKQFVHAIFCAPTGAYTDKGFPSRLTDEVFGALKSVGINRIFAFGYDNRKETIEKTYELCEKYGIMYFPTPGTAEDYLRILPGENGEKPYGELTEAEKADLDERFLTEVETMTSHPAFGGVFFCDEAGYLAADGIAAAKRAFDTRFADYEFHVNFYSYSIDEGIFWGGMGGRMPDALPFKLEGDLEIKFENRFHYYDKLVEHLLSKADFEYISQDKYPYECFWPTVPTSVHVALFELNAYFNQKKKKYGNKFYNYMQVGQWDGSGREMTFGEMALQMHVTAAYGSEGFAYFPGCYPLDFAGGENQAKAKAGGSALIDLAGNPTVYCDWLCELNRFFGNIEEDILSCRHLGVESFGTYQNGFAEEEIKALPDNECIFRGEIPELLRYESKIGVEADNEVLISVFERDGKKRYYVVNLSTVYANQVRLALPEHIYEVVTQTDTAIENGLLDIKLAAGSAAYIIEK